MQENTWVRLRDSCLGAHDSRNLAHIFSCITLPTKAQRNYLGFSAASSGSRTAGISFLKYISDSESDVATTSSVAQRCSKVDSLNYGKFFVSREFRFPPSLAVNVAVSFTAVAAGNCVCVF